MIAKLGIIQRYSLGELQNSLAKARGGEELPEPIPAAQDEQIQDPLLREKLQLLRGFVRAKT